MISLIISDIIDDPVEFISSGPTVLKKFNQRTSLQILNKLNLKSQISNNVFKCLMKNNDLNSLHNTNSLFF